MSIVRRVHVRISIGFIEFVKYWFEGVYLTRKLPYWNETTDHLSIVELQIQRDSILEQTVKLGAFRPGDLAQRH